MNTVKRILIVLGVLLGLCAGGSVATAAHADDDPTSVELKEVTAIAGYGQVEVRWATYSEWGAAGFNVMRGASETGPWEQANAYAIVAVGEEGGASYSFVDAGLAGGITYYYYIQEILLSGGTQDHLDHIVSATPGYCVYLPLIIGR